MPKGEWMPRYVCHEPDAKGVIWAGFMAREPGAPDTDNAGAMLFGKDEAGQFWVRVVCDDRPEGGVVRDNSCCLGPVGHDIAKWLADWFKPEEAQP